VVGTVRVLLGVGSLLLLPRATLAGPITTTTLGGGTTTTTVSTTTLPGTTTTTVSTTTLLTTTTTAPTTTTTTLPPVLTFAFEDSTTGSANTSFLSVEADATPMCVAGQVQGSSGNNQVTISYEAQGSVAKMTAKKVRGDDFGTVNVTLVITGPPALYEETISSPCELRAVATQRRTRSRVRLRCDFGPNYVAFPGLSPAHVTAIDDAFAGEPGVNAHSRSGRLTVIHTGKPAGQTPVSCSPSD
jgi:hypothetical protein